MTLFPSSTFFRRPCSQLLRQSQVQRRFVSHVQGIRSQPTFEQLGLSNSVVSALQEAFPNVQYPTYIQSQFIPAILHGQDVLLKDKTGSGKSFGLVLALLNSRRKYTMVEVDGKYVKQPVISSLVLTPHRDLAYQFYYWIESMYAATLYTGDMSAIAQVLLRAAASPVVGQVERMRAQPPHILIGTPQAVLDALQLEQNPLPLEHLSNVVVDEADYLIEYLPRDPNEYERRKFERDLKRHPSPTRQILDMIYGRARPFVPKYKRGDEEAGDHQEGKGVRRLRVARRPQLVMTSATLKSVFRTAVMAKGAWLGPSREQTAIITRDNSTESSVEATYGGSSLVHCALVVSDDGEIRNIHGAVNAETTAQDPSSPEQDAEGAEEVPVTEESLPVANEQDKAPTEEPSPFNPTALEAIAATFAIDVPRVALLILPSEAPVRRAVTDLRALGVNAHGLDVLSAEGGRGFLLQRRGAAPAENPTLLVSTLAVTRGMDLPDLTHVFILGVAKALTLDAYLHAAGRVGRFGREGKVVAVLEEAHMIQDQSSKKPIRKDEPKWMHHIYSKLGVAPVKIPFFEDAPEAAPQPEGEPSEVLS